MPVPGYGAWILPSERVSVPGYHAQVLVRAPLTFTLVPVPKRRTRAPSLNEAWVSSILLADWDGTKLYWSVSIVWRYILFLYRHVEVTHVFDFVLILWLYRQPAGAPGAVSDEATKAGEYEKLAYLCLKQKKWVLCWKSCRVREAYYDVVMWVENLYLVFLFKMHVHK